MVWDLIFSYKENINYCHHNTIQHICLEPNTRIIFPGNSVPDLYRGAPEESSCFHSEPINYRPCNNSFRHARQRYRYGEYGALNCRPFYDGGNTFNGNIVPYLLDVREKNIHFLRGYSAAPARVPQRERSILTEWLTDWLRLEKFQIAQLQSYLKRAHEVAKQPAFEFMVNHLRLNGRIS